MRETCTLASIIFVAAGRELLTFLVIWLHIGGTDIAYRMSTTFISARQVPRTQFEARLWWLIALWGVGEQTFNDVCGSKPRGAGVGLYGHNLRCICECVLFAAWLISPCDQPSKRAH